MDTKLYRALILFSAFAISPLSHAATSTSVTYVPNSTKKICQLTGDRDRETGLPTLNLTETRAGVVGTDLGFSFEHGGKLVFLFGDTTAREGITRGLNEDVIAFASSQSASPDDCVSFNVLTDSKDGAYHAPRIPELSNGTFEVPVGGVSANEQMYVFFSSGSNETKLMHRSYLGVSQDNGYSFEQKYFFSELNFINVTPYKVKTASVKGLPVTGENSVLLFGSGWYRHSDAYLSVVDEHDLDQKQAIRYFAGLNDKGKPMWSPRELDSKALFEHPCIGEFSVAYDENLAKWIMLYNCDVQRGINLRTADKPWGPWSASQVIFEPTRDGAYGKYMHIGYDDDSKKKDELSDKDQEEDWGGEYGPYLIPSHFEHRAGETTISYALSIHNPYQVVQMKTTLKLSSPAAKVEPLELPWVQTH